MRKVLVILGRIGEFLTPANSSEVTLTIRVYAYVVGLIIWRTQAWETTVGIVRGIDSWSAESWSVANGEGRISDARTRIGAKLRIPYVRGLSYIYADV